MMSRKKKFHLKKVISLNLFGCFFFFYLQDIIETSIPKKRCTKKKSPAIVLPDNISVQYSRIESFLRHSLSRNWIRYEFNYDEIEREFFINTNTFKSTLTTKFLQLKCTNMTRAEWNKVRKMISTQKSLRFSPKFVQQQRIDLEKYRCSYKILKDNELGDQLSKLNVPVENIFTNVFAGDEKLEIIRLIVETKKLFQLKSASVRELRDINIARTENQNVNDDETNSIPTKIVHFLENYNRQIIENFSKLMRYQMFKNALLFDALSKKNLYLALSPEYYRRKNELQIHEDNREFRMDSIIEQVSVLTLMNSILEMVLSVTEQEYLATDVGEYGTVIVNQRRETLKPIIKPDNFEYLDFYVVSLIDLVLKKISTFNI